MASYYILVLVFSLSLMSAAAERGGKARKALETFYAGLTNERDFNSTNWRYLFRSRSPQVFFDKYAQVLSKAFKAEGAHVNFAMVGACDGLADPTIRERFLPNKHWRGVFVEPMSVNIRDLLRYMESHGVHDRSFVLRAAASSRCDEPTIHVERPLYEEKETSKGDKGKKLPHWLRREIGSIVKVKPGEKAHALV